MGQDERDKCGSGWDAGEWAIEDVLDDDAAGKRFLVRCGDGSEVQAVEPPEDEQSSLAFRERLKKKAIRARDIRHDHVARTLGYIDDAGQLFVVEPNVEGVPLAGLIGPQKTLEPDAVLEVGLHVARALAAVHRHHLVHGWVRPSAVLVTDDRALLRACGVQHPKGEAAEQPEFMSPEQLSDHYSLRPESDFFSLGSTLFAAVVGRPPFLGETPGAVADAIRRGRPTFPGPDEPPIPENLGLLFAKLLAADPEQRPRSAAELIGDIEAVRRGENIERITEQPPAPEPAPVPVKRKRWAVAAAAAALALIVLAVVVFRPRPPEPAEPSAPTDHSPLAPAVAEASESTGPAKAGPAVKEPSREDLAAEACDDVDRYAGEHPHAWAEIIRRYQAVAAKYEGTRAGARAKHRAHDLAHQKSRAGEGEFAKVEADIDRLLKARRFGEALGVVNRFEMIRVRSGRALDAALRDRVRRQVDLVRAEAAGCFARESKAARRAVEQEKFAEARRICEDIVARYGIDEYVRAARKELDTVVLPLLAKHEQVLAARAAAARKKAYEQTAASVTARVKSFAVERAVAEVRELMGELKGSTLEAEAARHFQQLRRLLALKQRVIKKINDADPKLKSEALGIRAPASTIESADVDGITLRSGAKRDRRLWAALSDWERYAIARAVSDVRSPGDLAALGLLSLEQGNLDRAKADLLKAKALGAEVGTLLARAEKGAKTAPRPEDGVPARMLVEARTLVGEKKWLDALALLIPLKEKHAPVDYKVQQKLDEINTLLAACARGVAEADAGRDIAVGVETPLLKDGIDTWSRTGKGWRFAAGRASCENRAEHDVDLLKPSVAAPAYRLSVRCRVVSGNGLMVRVASDGDTHYDFGLELSDAEKTGLWYSRGGKVRKKRLAPLRLEAGKWVAVRAIITARSVRVECGGQSYRLPNELKAAPAARPNYGFITRQKSKAQFEDFRVRILRQQ